MKRLILTLIVLFTTYSHYSQISTTEVKGVPEVKTLKKYDSLLNHPKFGELNLLVGQDLYVKPLEKDGIHGREDGYPGFYEDIQFKKVYKENKSSVFHYSDHNSLSERYFKVLDIQKKSYKSFIFKLQDKKNEEIIYWEGENRYVEESDGYPGFYSFDYPFITVGFYEKLKERCINRSYVIGNVSWDFWGDNIDLNTGNKVDHPYGENEDWKCVDVTISEPKYKLCLVLENDKGEKVVVKYDRIVESTNSKFKTGQYPEIKVFTKEESNSYELKFGEKDWNKISQGTIWIGMTEEMCELSRGKPEKINQSTRGSVTFDQCIYEDIYIYFDDGILTSFQD